MRSVAGGWEQHVGTLVAQEGGRGGGRLPRWPLSLTEPLSFGLWTAPRAGAPSEALRSECPSWPNCYHPGFITNGRQCLMCFFSLGKVVLV